MTSPRSWITAAALAALAAAPAAAQDTLPTPAPVDVPAPEPAALSLAGSECQGVARYLNVRSVLSAQLSPDGRELLFITSTTGEPQLWVAPVRADGPAAPRQITFGANRVQFARWSPDGRWIAYGTDRGGNERTQFFLLSPDGTRERELTPADDFFRLFSGWSPAGSRISYVSNERNGSDFDLYVMDLDSDGRPGAPRMVMRGAGNLGVEAWRPDGEAVVLSQGRGEADNDLFLLDLRTQKLDTLFIPEQMSSYRGIQWTPDGQGFFVATSHQRDFAGLAHYHIPERALHWMEEPAHDVESVAASSDGRWLTYTINENGFSRLVARELGGRGIVPIPGLPNGVVTLLEWAEDAPRLAIGISGPGLPGDVWIYDAATGQTTRATESTLAGLDAAAFVSPEAVTIPGFDGVDVYGLLYKPRGAEGRRPPVVMMLHGGPTSQARPGFDPVKQYLLARGYAVLDLNFRGSTGFGQRFTQLDNKRLRPNAVRDMQSAVEWLRARTDVDGSRVAAMGGSYGGYMTLAAVAQLPEYFQAGVDFVGVANWISGLEDASPQLKNSDRIEYGNIDDPQDRAFFTEISPLSYADRIRSPLLVVHGANDPRVPVGEADQIVRAVRHRRGDVEYLRFPDEGHGIAKLQNRITAYQRIARFLDRVLGNDAMVCRGR
ncbi:MAG TPA: S9 family peptidase [Longimicrobium sp.]